MADVMKKLIALGLAASISACVIVVAPPAPPHPPKGPPMGMAQGVANGMAQGVKPGAGLRLWIWRESDGTWHVRSTTGGKRHVFRGLINGVTSPIKWSELESMELGDSMGIVQDGLVFHFDTVGHVDGFAFVPEDHGCVRFHITVDERDQPERIFVGPSGAHPPSSHFEICP